MIIGSLYSSGIVHIATEVGDAETAPRGTSLPVAACAAALWPSRASEKARWEDVTCHAMPRHSPARSCSFASGIRRNDDGPSFSA